MIEDNWGIIYAIMKSLNINELVIDKKYYELTPNDIHSMYFTTDVKTNKIKVVIKDSDKE